MKTENQSVLSRQASIFKTVFQLRVVAGIPKYFSTNGLGLLDRQSASGNPIQ